MAQLEMIESTTAQSSLTPYGLLLSSKIRRGVDGGRDPRHRCSV